MADLNKPYKITEKVNGILEKKLSIVEPKFVQQVTEWITKFQTSSGNIVRTKSNRDRMASFKTAMERYLERAGYYDMISQYLTGFDAMSEAQKEIQQDLNAISLTQSFLNQFKRVAIKQVVDNMTKQGLMTALINPIRNELNIAVNQGSSLSDVVESIRGQLSTTEKRQGILKKLSLQSTRDALGQYDGTVNEAVRKTYKLDALLYVGSLVKDSRPQCERWTKYEENGKRGLILFEQLEDEILWADNNGTGMIPNTTPENFCQNRGGYNCRHVAYPVRNPNKITKAGNVSEKVDPDISKAEQQGAIEKLKNDNIIAPKEEAPKEEAPKEEAPKEEAPKEEAPKEEAPKEEAPKEEAPKEEAPKEEAPKEEAPKEAEKPKEVKRNNYKKVKTVKEAKESVKSFMKENMGFKVNNVEYDENLSIDDINKLNDNLNNLSKEYNTVFDTQKSNPAFVFRRASNFQYGKIKYNEDGILTTVFFGNGISDEERISDFKFREKSKVDKDKLLLATSTHEFAHLIGTDKVLNSSKIKFYRTFWGNTMKIYKQYQDELLTNFDEVYLGRYANTNVNEFMAEAFTEYKLSSNPSKYALLMGQRIDKVFKK